MPYQPSKRISIRINQRQAGVSLLELGLGLMILSVLSVAVSSLVKTAVESQIAQRTNQEMQTIGLNIADDLRHDIQTADRASVVNASTLVLYMPVGNQLTYKLSGDNFTRSSSDGKGNRTYNSIGQNIKLRVLCPKPAGCFVAGALNADPATPSPTNITIPEIKVEQINNSNTAIDQAFGKANFSLKEFTFNVMSATDFQ